MRYFILALAPIVLSYACAHQQQTPSSSSQTTTTSAAYSGKDAGFTEAPAQGWDNSRSQQVQEPAPPVTQDSNGR